MAIQLRISTERTTCHRSETWPIAKQYQDDISGFIVAEATYEWMKQKFIRLDLRLWVNTQKNNKFDFTISSQL